MAKERDTKQLGGNGIGGTIQKTAVGILIGLLVIAFAIWGVNDAFSPRNTNAALSVGDVDISLQEFEDQFRRELQGLGAESGQQLTNEQAYQQGIHTRVLQRLLTDAVVSLDANDLKVGVNRRTARAMVKDIEAFQNDITGEFSEEKMEEILAQNRITRKTFENDIYRAIRREQTIPALIASLETPLGYATQRYQYLTEQRKVRVLTLSQRAVPAPETPDDETLKAYIDANQARYTTPPYRKATLLRIEPFDLTPDIQVTDQQIREAFEYKVELGEIGSSETRSLVQITTPDEATAKTVSERLIAGETPSAIVSALGLIAPVIYTDVEEDAVFDPETTKVGFSIAEGEAQAVLGSLGNWYAVAVTNINPAEVPDFDAQRADIETDLLNDLAQEKLFDITGEVEDALTDGLTLEEVAERVDIGLESLDYIDRSGVTRDALTLTGIPVIPGVAEDETILREIFTNDLAYETDLFQTSNKGWASVRVDDIIDEALRPFETVREDALAAWTAEQTEAALDTLMIDLVERAESGESLDAIVASLDGGATIEDVVIVRSTPGETLGPQVAVGVLEGNLGDIERGPGPLPMTRQISKINAIVANQDALAGEFADVAQSQLTNEINGDIQQAYQGAILRENPLRQYPENIRQTLGISSP